MLYMFVFEYLPCDFLFYMRLKKYSLLKGRDKDGFPVYQEKLIRESIRKFPYCEATLLQQLVRSIAPVEIVSFSCHEHPFSLTCIVNPDWDIFLVSASATYYIQQRVLMSLNSGAGFYILQENALKYFNLCFFSCAHNEYINTPAFKENWCMFFSCLWVVFLFLLWDVCFSMPVHLLKW